MHIHSGFYPSPEMHMLTFAVIKKKQHNQVERILFKYNTEQNGKKVIDKVYQTLQRLEELNNYYQFDDFVRVQQFEKDLEELQNTQKLIEEIKSCDIFMAINGFDFRSLTFQIGVALSKRKNVILFVDKEYPRDYSISHKDIYVITLNERFNYRSIDSRLNSILNYFLNNLITPLRYKRHQIDFVTYTGTRSGLPRALEFNRELKRFFRKSFGIRGVREIESIEGSWRVFFEIMRENIKEVFDFAEKIVFIIPEWQKKRQEVQKMKLENKKTEIEILKEEVILNDLEQSLHLERTINFLTIIEKYKDLGFRNIQFREDLLLKIDKENNIKLIEPPKLANENDSEQGI